MYAIQSSKAVLEKMREHYSRELCRIAGRLAELKRIKSWTTEQVVELIKLRKDAREFSEAIRACRS